VRTCVLLFGRARARSALWTSWALYFQLQLCVAHADADEHAAAAECLRTARGVAQEHGDTNALVRLLSKRARRCTHMRTRLTRARPPRWCAR
jgi:hypothetical protein